MSSGWLYNKNDGAKLLHTRIDTLKDSSASAFAISVKNLRVASEYQTWNRNAGSISFRLKKKQQTLQLRSAFCPVVYLYSIYV